MDDIGLMLMLMHSLYVDAKAGNKKWTDVEERLKSSLRLYRFMSYSLEKLDLEDPYSRFLDILRGCETDRNISQWMVWAKVDSNLATLNLTGHTRVKEGDSDGGQAH